MTDGDSFSIFPGRQASKAMHSGGVISDVFHPKQVVPPEFYGHKLCIGYKDIREMGQTKNVPFYIDVGESFIGIILGKRGSGKTFISRRMMDLAHHSKKSVVILADVKNEYAFSVLPAAEKFAKQLGPKEVPTGMPIRAFYPAYLGPAPERNESFQFSLKDLSKADWDNIFDSVSPTQTMALQHLFRLAQEGNAETVADIQMILDNNDEINPSTKASLKLKFQALETSGILGNSFNVDIDQIINNGYGIVLDLVGYEQQGRRLASVCISILARKLMQLRRDKVIKKKMFVFMDEAHEFCNNKYNISSTDEMVKLVNLSRSWGITVIFATQNLAELPDEIKNQAKYIFLPYNIDRKTLELVLSIRSRINPNRWAERNELYDFHASLRKRGPQREWVVVGDEGYENFWPYAPMSYHQEEAE